MQLRPTPTHVPSPAATAAAPAAASPQFQGGLEFSGTDGRFTAFAATATPKAYGDEKGYATLRSAIKALTMLTVGVREPAAGVFELDGRFYGRQLANTVTFAGGKTWTGMWRLEQHPADRELLAEGVKGITRSEALRAVVDGAHRIDVSHIAVAPAVG